MIEGVKTFQYLFLWREEGYNSDEKILNFAQFRTKFCRYQLIWSALAKWTFVKLFAMLLKPLLKVSAWPNSNSEPECRMRPNFTRASSGSDSFYERSIVYFWWQRWIISIAFSRLCSLVIKWKANGFLYIFIQCSVKYSVFERKMAIIEIFNKRFWDLTEK